MQTLSEKYLDQQLVEQAIKLAGSIKNDHTGYSRRMLARSSKLEEQAIINSAKRGILLLTLKLNSPRGTFENTLQELKISKSSAKNAMSVAKMLLAMPEAKRQTSGVLNLNQSQLLELSRLPIHMIEDMDEEDLEHLGDMPVRSLKAKVKELKAQLSQTDDARVNAENALGHEKAKSPTSYVFSAFANIRADAVALPSMIDAAMETSRQNVSTVISSANAPGGQGDAALSAAKALHHTWATIYLQIHEMLSALNKTFGNDIQGLENLPVYDEREWGFVESELSRQVESYRAFAKASARQRGQ